MKKEVSIMSSPPVLVGFLANDDPPAKKYAEWTAISCEKVGIKFELREVSQFELEDQIEKANEVFIHINLFIKYTYTSIYSRRGWEWNFFS